MYLKNCRVYKKFPYTTLSSNMIEYIHSRTLMMMEEVKTILDNNNIPYAIVGGTLLGAYTRQGFIPWDEDIDIGVFEKDYDRMIAVLIEQLPKDIFVQCSITEPKYYHEWIKVRDTKSRIYPSNDGYENQGVWIDIYKISRIRKSMLDYTIAYQHKMYLDRRLFVGNISSEDYENRVKNNHLLERMSMKDSEKSVNFDSKNVCDEYIYLIGTASKPYIEEKSCFPLKYYLFENQRFTSFNNAETYLRNHYGEEFMHFAIEEERYISIEGVEYNK